jgi:4-hydroxy-3-polyprenylbenzoate decarboxylase
MKRRHMALAITGASGARYSLRLGSELLRNGIDVSFLISRAGFLVLREECGLAWDGNARQITEHLKDYFAVADQEGVQGFPVLRYYPEDDLCAPLASGSAAADVMIVCPCTMGTLSRIASGHSGNLIERAADVMLKERRPLVVVPRETPLSELHLENMLKLAKMGVRIVPAMPAFYHHPESVDDLVAFVVGKILDSVGIEQQLFRRWREAD